MIWDAIFSIDGEKSRLEFEPKTLDLADSVLTAKISWTNPANNFNSDNCLTMTYVLLYEKYQQNKHWNFLKSLEVYLYINVENSLFLSFLKKIRFNKTLK